MLVLNRCHGESIVISKDEAGCEIRLKVIGIRGGQVRIAIDAPQDYAVDREEIHLRKMAEKSEAQAQAV